MSTVAYPLSEADCVRRGTNRRKGRTCSLAPGNGAVRHLHYGRIILDGSDAAIEFSTGERETGLICLRGKAVVVAAGGSFDLSPYDAVYAPRGSQVRVTPAAEGCDFAEISAP